MVVAEVTAAGLLAACSVAAEVVVAPTPRVRADSRLLEVVAVDDAGEHVVSHIGPA